MLTQQPPKRTRQPARSTTPMTFCEQDWVARARAGETGVRDTIILSLQEKIERMAFRLRQRSPLPMCGFEVGDLVQSANEAMLLQFPQALQEDKANPIAYLLQVAKLTMYDFFNGRQGTIRTDPKSRSPIVVLSLDMPLSEHEGDPSRTLVDTVLMKWCASSRQKDSLYEIVLQSVEALPEKQRDVVKRHYGLEGFAPESLMSIAREWSPGTASRPKSAHYHHTQAVLKLRTLLSCMALESCVGGRE